jgi:hypothetical protein
MTEAQRRVVLACWQMHTWKWVALHDLWPALAGDVAAFDAIPGAVAEGWLLYDDGEHAVRTTWPGRRAAGLPLCSFSPAAGRILDELR